MAQMETGQPDPAGTARPEPKPQESAPPHSATFHFMLAGKPIDQMTDDELSTYVNQLRGERAAPPPKAPKTKAKTAESSASGSVTPAQATPTPEIETVEF